MDSRDHIEQNPQIMLGKPVIKGTRITVQLVVERLGDGWIVEELLGVYPHIDRAQVQVT